MIKKAPGGRRKFRAEYLTLSESELCLGSGRRAGVGGRDGRQGTRKKSEARERQKKRSCPVAMLYTGIQRGIVSRVYANLKDPPLRLASREDVGSTQSGNFNGLPSPTRDFIMSV